jgi:hypothetical protein
MRGGKLACLATKGRVKLHDLIYATDTTTAAKE